MTAPAEVVEYDVRWPGWFDEIRAGLEPLLVEVPHVVEHVGSTATPVEPGRTRSEALSALATAWLDRPADTSAGSGGGSLTPLGTHLLAEVLADEDTRSLYAQLMKLNAILLGLALERLQPDDRQRCTGSTRQVRVAETVLTTLRGAEQLAAAAPGFVQPFAIVKACAQLATLELADRWERPPTSPPVRPADEAWTPPVVIDVVRSRPARSGPDGLVVILGLNRLAAAEDAVRAAPPGTAVTIALVTSRPDELGSLARLTAAELLACLRQAFPESAWPAVQIVHDESGAFAAAAGVEEIGDGLEFAIRVAGGRIVARAEGLGATYAAAESFTPATSPRFV